jgi:hypothetical protein
MSSANTRNGFSPFSKNLDFKALRQIEEFNIQSHLRSNIISAEAVSALLACCKIELTEYDKEISRLHSAIFVLEERKKNLGSQMQRLQKLLSPVRKLPREVLSEIFLYCDPTFRIGPDGIHAPSRSIAAVCTYWRSIALSDRQLWTDISLDIRTTLEAQVVHQEIESILDLSKDALLSINLEDSEIEDDEDYPGTHTSSFTLLLAQSHRWKKLRLALRPTIWPAQLLLPGLDLQNLESLEISLDTDPDEVEKIDASFATARKLTSISLQHVYDLGLALSLPWNQITYFSFNGYDTDCFLSLASGCPQLIKASVAMMCCRGEDDFEGPFTSQMSSLDIQIGAGGDEDVLGAIRLFESLTVPDLSSFTLSSNDITEDLSLGANNVIGKLLECLNRSKCQLTTLTLKDITIINPQVTLLDLLSATTSVENLTLDDRNSVLVPFVREPLVCKLDCNYEDSKTSIRAHNPLLPSLRCLVIKTKSRTLKDATLVSVVRSRWQPFDDGGHRVVASLSSVELLLAQRKVERPEIEPLCRMARAGLRITLLDAEGIVI